MSDQNDVPQDAYQKPMGKGGDLPPLPLLPDREWLGARIVEVKLQYVVFNGQIQYMMKQEKEIDPDTGEEKEVYILDEDGNKRPRMQFNIKFALHNYTLPNNEPRCCWLKIGASLADKAHLPTLLFNLLGANFGDAVATPADVVKAIKGLEVKLQLRNKLSKTDPDKPPYQEVIYDAVKLIEANPGTPAPEPITEEKPGEPVAWDE